jgi:3-methyl-2-oxobutanoate hydroxymethyltransferase
MQAMADLTKRMTVPEFTAKKRRGEKLCMLTAYDYPMAALLDRSGVDAVLVGDSLGMVVQGKSTTVPVTLDQIIYHAEMVVRAVSRALVVADMPFLTCNVSIERSIENAGRILQETGCQAVKMEGGAEQAQVISALVSAGIPVMAHVGLRPQYVHVTGGYRVQRDAEQLLRDAHAAEAAGAFSILLECIPAAVAADITSRLTIPTIGIGAGKECDGQVLVIHDLLGMGGGYLPRFVRQYADLGSAVREAVGRFAEDVRTGQFPGPAESYD